MSYATRTLIVPAAFQQLAQGLCEAAAEGDAGKGMFTTGLSATGASPATHYISAGYIEQQFADILPLTTVDEEGNASTRPGNVEFVEGIASQAGITLPAGTVEALSTAVDVSEQDPFAAMARLGIKLIEVAS